MNKNPPDLFCNNLLTVCCPYNMSSCGFWIFLMPSQYCIWCLFSLMWHCLPVVSCFSLEDQMEQAAIVYWELLEGNEKPVAGSTCEFLAHSLIVKLI